MSFTRLSREGLLNRLKLRIKEFYENERQLLIDKASERALVFRLGTYLLNDFLPAEVYAEYNRMHHPDGSVSAKTVPVTNEDESRNIRFDDAEDIAGSENNSIEEGVDHEGNDEPSEKLIIPDLAIFIKDRDAALADKLVIEVKKSTGYTSGSGFGNDIFKLKEFTKIPGRFGYILGCHLILDKDYFLVVCYWMGQARSLFKFDYNHNRNQWTEHQLEQLNGFEYTSLAVLKRMLRENEREQQA